MIYTNWWVTSVLFVNLIFVFFFSQIQHDGCVYVCGCRSLRIPSNGAGPSSFRYKILDNGVNTSGILQSNLKRSGRKSRMYTTGQKFGIYCQNPTQKYLCCTYHIIYVSNDFSCKNESQYSKYLYKVPLL